MSRAFIREPEPRDPACPSCGVPGGSVGSVTLDALLNPAARSRLPGAAYYCPNPACPTAYYSAWAATVPVVELAAVPYPKNPGGLICPCFGVSASEVVRDAQDGRKAGVKELLEKARGSGARCAVSCADGQSCISRVMLIFREHFSP
jgi:hypothetical protein